MKRSCLLLLLLLLLLPFLPLIPRLSSSSFLLQQSLPCVSLVRTSFSRFSFLLVLFTQVVQPRIPSFALSCSSQTTTTIFFKNLSRESEEEEAVPAESVPLFLPIDCCLIVCRVSGVDRHHDHLVMGSLTQRMSMNEFSLKHQQFV